MRTTKQMPVAEQHISLNFAKFNWLWISFSLLGLHVTPSDKLHPESKSRSLDNRKKEQKCNKTPSTHPCKPTQLVNSSKADIPLTQTPHLPQTPSFNVSGNSTKTTPSPSNPPRQLNILLHNGDSFCMNSAQIRILEQMHQKGFSSFL